MGEHAGELGWVSTGAFGSWEPSTSFTAHSVPPVQLPAPALGCVVQPRTGGGAGSILPSSSLGPWGTGGGV